MPSAKKLLFIGATWPEPSSSAGGRRTLDVLRLFRDLGFELHFASHASRSDLSYSAADIFLHPILLNDDGFDSFVHALAPEVVVFDKHMTEEQYGWRVSQHCPDALRILDTIDLHFLRVARQDAIRAGLDPADADLQTDLARREIASILRCDLSLVISEVELGLLTGAFEIKPDLLHYLPFLYDEEGQEEFMSFAERSGFVSIGNFLHPPNADSVLQLKVRIWPSLRVHLKHAEIHIYGAYLPDRFRQMQAPKEGFFVHGRAEDALRAIGAARVLLAPLRFGAGLKGKLFEAMLTGTPSVTTPVGAEGMWDGLSWPGAVANTEEEFVRNAVLLHENEEWWNSCSRNAATLLQQRFAFTSFADRFSTRIELLLRAKQEHRRRNFLGSVLNHQSVQAARYLSRYIIEKNRGTGGETND